MLNAVTQVRVLAVFIKSTLFCKVKLADFGEWRVVVEEIIFQQRGAQISPLAGFRYLYNRIFYNHAILLGLFAARLPVELR